MFGVSGLNSAECFDVRCGEWRMIAPMSTRRSSVGVGVLNGNITYCVIKCDFSFAISKWYVSLTFWYLNPVLFSHGRKS